MKGQAPGPRPDVEDGPALERLRVEPGVQSRRERSVTAAASGRAPARLRQIALSCGRLLPEYTPRGEPSRCGSRPLPVETRRPPRPRTARARWPALFLKLGAIGFGGPAAHIALMEDEVVRRRRWLTREEFLDLLGATNLIPGPNSTEMAIHVGFVRAGWRGLVVGGVAFILPAALVTLALAVGYARYGRLPAAGMAPLRGQARDHRRRGPGGVGPRPEGRRHSPRRRHGAGRPRPLPSRRRRGGAPLRSGARAPAGPRRRDRRRGCAAWRREGFWPSARRPPSPTASVGSAPPPRASASPQLGLVFLKVGSILFGSGYVLLAFLRPDLVERTGWLTDAAAPGRGRGRPAHPRPGAHDRDLHRLPRGGRAGRARGDRRHLPAVVRVRGGVESAHPAAPTIVLGRRVPRRRERGLGRLDGDGDLEARARAPSSTG